jgi:hypothetical protein
MTKPTQKGKLGLIFSTFFQGKNSVFGLRSNQVEHQNVNTEPSKLFLLSFRAAAVKTGIIIQMTRCFSLPQQ